MTSLHLLSELTALRRPAAGTSTPPMFRYGDSDGGTNGRYTLQPDASLPRIVEMRRRRLHA